MGAGGKRVTALADSGRFPMAWSTRPCFRGDLFLCMDVLPSWYFRSVYETDAKPAMRCIGLLQVVTLCADVACLAWVWRMRGQIISAPAGATIILCSLKPWLQKRLKKRMDCGGKHLGCSQRGEKRITVRTKWQSGRIERRRYAVVSKGKPPPSATRGMPRGNPTRT